MPRVPIDDLDDPRIAIFRSLKATNLTRWDDRFVVEGEKLVERLLQSRFPLDSVLVTDRHVPRVATWVPESVPLYVVPHAKIDALVGFNFHQGVLACGQRCPWPGIEDIVGDAGRRSTLVVCPKLSNPENLGAIVRLCDVFGVEAVVVGGPCPDPLSRRVLRVSMGCSLRVPVLGSTNLENDLSRLRSKFGVEFAATVVDPDAEPFNAVQRPERLGLLLGSESDGLSAEWWSWCDRRITIPMRPGAESLNVAVAAGVILYYFTMGNFSPGTRPAIK
jgi:tRNA G18 (ribose-2'-O)-methylase SpoU